MAYSEKQYLQEPFEYDNTIILEDRKGILFTFLFIAPLIVSSISVAALSGFNYLVVGLGVIGFAAYLLSSIQEGFKFPKEVLLFGLFIVWSISGLFVCSYVPSYLSKFFTMVKFLVLVLIISHYSKNRACVGLMFFALLIGVTVVAASAYISGQYNRAEVFGERVAGIVLNANAFAMSLVYGSLALLYFFKTWKSFVIKIGIIGVLLVIARLVIASGSRKGFISFLMVLFLWFFFSYRREILHRPFAAIAAMVAIVFVSGFLYTRMADTTMAERLEQMVQTAQAGGAGSGGGSLSKRQFMIERGLQIIKNNPVAGIGLNQYSIVSGFKTYAHNNYIEVFGSTGILGGVIYYSIFLVLWLRLRRLSKLPLGDKEREFVNIAKAFIVMRIVLDMVIVSYFSKKNWIFLSLIIGFSYHLEQYLKQQDYTNTAEQES